MRRFRWSILVLALSLVVTGCATPAPTVDPEAKNRMLSLLLPVEIEIVQPFTRVKSFDDDPTPDGIELWLQAVNALGNNGLNIVGTVRAELYEYVPASAEHKGRRLEHWQIELATADQQRGYWSGLTKMYEFRLAIDPAKIPTAVQYVLAVTYNAPTGEHLIDECVIAYHPVGGFATGSTGEGT
ncbi:MAG: hypothetical protein PVI86_19380 [Phycisphaerae bacterium]|jgi:hypothetical protein